MLCRVFADGVRRALLILLRRAYVCRIRRVTPRVFMPYVDAPLPPGFMFYDYAPAFFFDNEYIAVVMRCCRRFLLC